MSEKNQIKLIAKANQQFESNVTMYVEMGQLPASVNNFSKNEEGDYAHVPTLLLWQFFQLGYAARLNCHIEAPKEAGGIMIEHMPKGSGFRTGYEFLLKSIESQGFVFK